MQILYLLHDYFSGGRLSETTMLIKIVTPTIDLIIIQLACNPIVKETKLLCMNELKCTDIQNKLLFS